MEEGLIFRRAGKSPLLPGDEIAAVALVKAWGRTVLACRLKPGVAVMKRHPGAGFLRAKGLDFDGGDFVDQMTETPEQILHRFEQRVRQKTGGEDAGRSAPPPRPGGTTAREDRGALGGRLF